MPFEKKEFKRGLIVGKFSPLHLGHEFLIQHAEAECEELVILSWSNPEFAGCASAQRRIWFQKRFPHLRVLVLDEDTLLQQAQVLGVKAPPLPGNDAPELESRRFVGWVCANVLRFQPQAVFTSEDYGEGFAAELTRYFADKNPSSEKVIHRNVDQPRSHVPVSGSALRDHLHTMRSFLAPEIYADFVDRIALLGGESTGKTTLAQRLARKLKTAWVPEYGRELWEKQDGKLGYNDMLHIAKTQIAREEKLAESANQFLICDSTPLTTYFYSLEMFGRAEKELEQLAKRDYAKVFLCEADFQFVQDGTRRDETFRQTQQRWYRQQLDARKIPYFVLHGDVEARVQQVLKALIAG